MILCPDCFHGISEAVAFLRAYKRVYSCFSDLHIQIFGSPDFQPEFRVLNKSAVSSPDKLLSVMDLCDTV